VYDPKADAVYVTSNQIDPLRGTEKCVVISKLKRSLYGNSWTRHQVPSDIRMPSGGVAYNDGVLDGILYCAQGVFTESCGAATYGV
jgi:gluconolactonase